MAEKYYRRKKDTVKAKALWKQVRQPDELEDEGCQANEHMWDEKTEGIILEVTDLFAYHLFCLKTK